LATDRSDPQLFRAIPLEVRDDPRGRLVEVLRPAVTQVGQVNLIWIAPGQERGRHYHKQSGEWFLVIAGVVAFQFEPVSPADGTVSHRQWAEFSGDQPTLVWVPCWIQHTLRNPSPDTAAIVLVGLLRPFEELRDDVFQADEKRAPLIRTDMA
jgi:dTDP-4-dehydrorhamnose 3,5-epimerase-like enzyme